LLLQAHAAAVGGGMLVEPAAQRSLAALSGFELGLQLGEVRSVHDLLAVTPWPSRHPDPHIDVRRGLRLPRLLLVAPAAIDLRAGPPCGRSASRWRRRSPFPPRR